MVQAQSLVNGETLEAVDNASTDSEGNVRLTLKTKNLMEVGKRMLD
jgi:hypothetical protein